MLDFILTSMAALAFARIGYLLWLLLQIRATAGETVDTSAAPEEGKMIVAATLRGSRRHY